MVLPFLDVLERSTTFYIIIFIYHFRIQFQLFHARILHVLSLFFTLWSQNVLEMNYLVKYDIILAGKSCKITKICLK